jgi:hypothetical protein
MITLFRRKLEKFSTKTKERGIYYSIRVAIRRIQNLTTTVIQLYLYKILGPKTFTFQGRNYSYFYNAYNRTWENERVIEVPIIWQIVKHCVGRKILEVGNVLSHYFPVDHDILDKYEKANGVINQDVVDFSPQKKYDLVVSISTLEHVGWDEKPKEPYRVLRAIDNLKNLLASNGRIVVTIPVGYNAELDRLLRNGAIDFSEMSCLKRTSSYNNWVETGGNALCQVKYDFSIPSANAVVILVFR